jgi:hypothetical protein
MSFRTSLAAICLVLIATLVGSIILALTEKPSRD